MPRNSEVNFYLKPAGSDGKSLIFLNYKYNRQRLFFSFGERINPKDWNDNKQRAKNKSITVADEKHLLNDLLESLSEVCLKAYKTEKVNGIPSPAVLKQYLNNFLNHNLENENKSTSFFNLIDRFIRGEIKNRGRDKSNATLKTYKTTRNHLRAYEIENKIKLTFESITLDFFYNFSSYLKSLGLIQNTIAKNIKTLKVFLSEAVDLGYSTNMQFKHKKFNVEINETDSIYLSDKEINNLYRFDLSHHNKLEKVRDLFVFGCCVGLRYSDYSSIKPENIIKIEDDSFLKIITSKTKELVIIPCSQTVLEIFEKYKFNRNNLPPAPSNQKFNEYIKDVCEKSGLVEEGRLLTAPNKPLYECVSSHTARRSFATNLYLDGYPTIEIMKITGHKSEKAFMKYIKVTKLDAAKRLNAHMKKRWIEKMLKVA